MATTIRRTLTNFYNNKLLARFFNSFKELNSSTPIPNQALPMSFNNYNEEAIIYFTHIATQKLQYIMNIAHKQSKVRNAHKKNDREIEFFCTGYVADTGDYVIEDITIPALNFAMDPKTSKVNYDQLFLSMKSSEAHTTTTTEMSEYLRCFNMNQDNYRRKNLALYGTTRSTDKFGNDRTCPTLKDLANSIVAGDTPFHYPISTGVLVLTPKEVVQNSNKQFEFVNGSMECLITDYQQNENGFAKPTTMQNVTRCKIAPEPDNIVDAKISKSIQDLSNIPSNIRFANIPTKTNR